MQNLKQAGRKEIMSKAFGIKAVFNISGNAGKVMNNLSKSAGKLQRQVSFVGKNMSTVAGSIGKFAAPLVALGGAASLAGISAMVKNTAEYGDQIANMVERVGWGSKAFQEYAHAARFSDMTTEEFASNIEKMTRNMGALRAGTGSLLTGIEKISPTLSTQLKATKTNEEAFELMIKAIQKVEDPLKKTYLANLAFGKSGMKMVQLANHGADGLEKLKKQAHEMGVVLGEDALSNSALFNDSLEENKEVLRGLSSTISSKLLPVIIPMIKGLNNWIMANKDLIATRVDAFVKKFAEWISTIDFKAVGNSLVNIIGVIGTFIDIITSSKWVLVGFIALMNIQLVGAIWNIGSGLIKLMPIFMSFSAALLACPITWIVAGIAAIAGAAYLIYKNWEPIKSFFAGLWDGVKNIFSNAFDFIMPIIDAIMNPLNTLFKAGERIGAWVADKVGSDGGSNTTQSNSTQAAQLSSIPQNLQQTYAANKQTNSKTEVVVKFDNMPKEASVEKISQNGQADLGVEYGYALGGAS